MGRCAREDRELESFLMKKLSKATTWVKGEINQKGKTLETDNIHHLRHALIALPVYIGKVNENNENQNRIRKELKQKRKVKMP